MILVDGSHVEMVSVLDRGLMYGDGVFRTLQIKNGRVTHLKRHLDKLRADCTAIKLPPLDSASIERDINRVIRDSIDGVLKLIVTRGSGARGYRIPAVQHPTRIVMTVPAPDYPAHYASDGIRVVLCETKLPWPPAAAGVKSLNRLENVLARSEWDDPAIAEGLMRDAQECIVCGTMSNLFSVQDGVLQTSDREHCGVAGVQRDRIIEFARKHGIALAQRSLRQADLGGVEELFVCNSLIGIWPITSCGEWQWPIGPITCQLQSWISGNNDDC